MAPQDICSTLPLGKNTGATAHAGLTPSCHCLPDGSHCGHHGEGLQAPRPGVELPQAGSRPPADKEAESGLPESSILKKHLVAFLLQIAGVTGASEVTYGTAQASEVCWIRCDQQWPRPH